ncbi:hypothetical protein Rhe02_96110 [Rhizocola hellebori]|uniref:Uncharacterized protein n=1 Tax=Rhizocola hellebori TaxID=1392758 RepID=A0A8J3VLL9_9ACTN|nr:hypothetical protein [Rhizocola hellebori]GIH11544.1 hypothetical protein Rhe02_96110 [Rhizocola hellebori]
MASNGDNRVRWPGNAFSAQGDDLASPIKILLEQLRLLETFDKQDRVSLGGTPLGLQVITAGASSMAKWWTWVVAALGGGTALIAGIKGLPGKADSSQRTMFIAALAVLLGAVTIAIALIVRADLSARAVASAAQYGARSAVAAALLENLQHAGPAAPAPPGPQAAAGHMGYVVKRRGENNWAAVKSFAWEADGTIAVVTEDRKILSKDVEALVSLAV